MSAVRWTDADAAELDVLLHELARGYVEHRKLCRACQPGDCLDLVSWRTHLEECPACRGDAPLTHGAPCELKRQFIIHGQDCVRCNPCPSVSLAVDVVTQWREARELLSRAAWLGTEQVTFEGVA